MEDKELRKLRRRVEELELNQPSHIAMAAFWVSFCLAISLAAALVSKGVLSWQEIIKGVD